MSNNSKSTDSKKSGKLSAASKWLKMILTKGIITAAMAGLITLLAYISFYYNVLGGEAFTSNDDEVNLWALTFLALTLLQCVFSLIAQVFDEKKIRLSIYGFVVALAFVSIFGGTAGRFSSISKQEAKTGAQELRANARQAGASAKLNALTGISEGLSYAGKSQHSGTRVAAQNKLSAVSNDVDSAVKMADEAAAIMENTTVIKADFGIGKTIFLLILSLCVEFGMSILSWLLGQMYLRQIVSAFQSLMNKEETVKEEESTSKTEEKPAVKK